MLLNTHPKYAKSYCHQIHPGFSHGIACILLIFAALMQNQSVSGQCMMIPLSLDAQASKSDLVVEGVVKDKNAFITAAGNFIYTTYQIEITKIFKGQPEKSIVRIVEEGGQVGNRNIEVSPGISLQVGETGTFFLERFTFKDHQDGQRYSEFVYSAYAVSYTHLTLPTNREV